MFIIPFTIVSKKNQVPMNKSKMWKTLIQILKIQKIIERNEKMHNKTFSWAGRPIVNMPTIFSK